MTSRAALATESSLLFALVALMFVNGCQKTPTTVSGTVTLDGSPLVIHDGMRGTVVFQPARDGPILNGNIDPQGSYRLAAGTTFAVAPGKYKVTVSAVEIIPPTADRPLPSSTRITPSKFASMAESDLSAEVVPGPNDIDLKLISDTNSASSSGEQSVEPEETKN